MTPPDDATLRAYRETAGLTQAQVGEIFGVSQSTVAGWDAARRARAGEPKSRAARKRHTRAELERYLTDLLEASLGLLTDTALIQSASEQTARARAMISAIEVLDRLCSSADSGEQGAVSRTDLLERVKRATESARALRVVSGD